MDGILIIDKPAGITSHDVVARVRRVLKTKKVGHTGTLDPFATGVLVVLVGKATRLTRFLHKNEKEYEAQVQFGYETDTGDLTGARDADSGLTQEEIAKALAASDLDKLLEGFRGDIKQTPPMYSAKKVDGERLYRLARKGVDIERKAVDVTISNLEVLDPRTSAGSPSTMRISVTCSAGTYIRTLAEDIGRAIGLGAHLTELRRIRAGRYRIDEAIPLHTLMTYDSPLEYLRPAREALEDIAVFELSDERVERTKRGMSTRDLSNRFSDGQTLQMVDHAGRLIAVGCYDDSEKVVQPKMVLS